ncbi:MAG: hypothetical protein ACJ8F7_20425, partial [Gemmataceae bacterium]
AQNERRGIMVNVDPQQIPLAPVLSRLAPVEAPDCCLKAANALMAALSNKENDTSQMEAQLNALHALAAHLPPSGAWAVRVKTAEVMTQSLLEPPSLMSGLRPWAMNSSMSKLASEFGPPEAATVCRQILAGLPRIFAEVNTSLGKNSDDFSPEGIQRNLARVKLFGAMDALATLANRLDSKDAADIGPSAAALLDKALKKNPQDPLAMMALQRGRVLATVHLKFAKRSAELTRDFVAATDDLTVAALADALSASADQLTPADAAAVCDHLMSKLSTYVIKNTDISAQLGMGSTSALGELLKAFQVVSARLAPQAASAVSARAAKILMEALASEPGEKNAVAIAQGLENLADRLSAPDAATVAVQLQWSLDKALRGQLKSDFGAIVPLARALAALAPVSKSAISRVATQSIGLRINNESDPMRVGRLAEATAVLASGLEPNDAAHRCSAAAHAVRRAIEKNTSDVNTAVLVVHLGELARWTDPQQACPLLLEALSRAPQSRLSSPNMKSFAQALVGVDAPARQRRTAAVAGVIGGTGPLAALAALPVAAQPLPCRLDTPALVELLKHPLCVGEPRRAVLDQIELRYGRKFVDVWEFVEFANQQGLKLDFTRPPKGLAAQ